MVPYYLGDLERDPSLDLPMQRWEELVTVPPSMSECNYTM